MPILVAAQQVSCYISCINSVHELTDPARCQCNLESGYTAPPQEQYSPRVVPPQCVFPTSFGNAPLLNRRGPTLEEALEQEGYDMHPLPSDEAWFGEPDPTKYAAGTNDLTKEQLAEEVAKGNVCTLRQLKEHLLTATEEELAVSALLVANVLCVLCDFYEWDSCVSLACSPQQ